MADVKAFRNQLIGGNGFQKGIGGNPIGGLIKDIDTGALCDANEPDCE